MLALHAGPLGNERWRDDLTRVPPLAERAMEYVAGAARFVTCSQLAVAGDPLKPFPQLRQISREAFEVRRALRPGRQHRDRDRLLVHIHPKIDD